MKLTIVRKSGNRIELTGLGFGLDRALRRALLQLAWGRFADFAHRMERGERPPNYVTIATGGLRRFGQRVQP